MASRTNADDNLQDPFLDTDPPHWAARGLAYLLILLFLSILLAAIVIQIPETVSGSFVLTHLRGTDPVRASDNGIVTEVRVSEGLSVAKGSPLFVIQSQTVGDRATELRTLEMQKTGTEKKLSNAKMKYESERLGNIEEERRLKGRLAYLTRMMDLKKKQLVVMKELAERFEKLHKEGIANEAEYTNHELEVGRISVELEQFQTEYADAEAGIKKIRHELEARQAEYQTLEQSIHEGVNTDKIRMEALNKELAFSTGDELTIPAPCSGMVVDLQIQAPGAVVHDGDILCALTCSGETLQAKLNIPQTGVVRIKPGQGVKLLYDAFPYQRYGVRFGTVRWVSPASVAVKESTVFPVLVDIQEQSIVIRGQSRSLMPGMGGTAQVVVDTRSLISHAFAPIRQLKEVLAKPPQNRKQP
ncbi:HlyD family efflux transporter periplasmic adaptor subunit [bacterium]|nr:HlyD family efflux transporter periplasmic adaptor subunit [bacterium]MCI0602736.1 HlyD family efflux transporter periplasmic adaptor subunit [bacterium]